MPRKSEKNPKEPVRKDLEESPEKKKARPNMSIKIMQSWRSSTCLMFSIIKETLQLDNYNSNNHNDNRNVNIHNPNINSHPN